MDTLRYRAGDVDLHDYIRHVLLDHIAGGNGASETPVVDSSEPLPTLIYHEPEVPLQEEGVVTLHFNPENLKSVESVARYRFLQRRNGATSPDVTEYISSLISRDIAAARQEIIKRRRL